MRYKKEIAKKEVIVSKSLWWDFFWERVKSIDSRRALEDISWTKFINNDSITFRKNTDWTEQIIVNWKTTWSRIDKNWKVWSYSWWWPNWTNWVFRYNKCTGSELAWWIKDKYPELCESKTVKKQEIKETIEEKSEIDFDKITPFTRWLQSIDKKFGRFDYSTFIVTIWESQSWKTEFTFFQARQNALRWHKVCYLALEMTKKQMILRICQKRANVTKEEWDNKSFDDSQKQIMKNVYDKLWDFANLDISYIKTPTIEIIKQTILEKSKEWYSLFYIDNLWFITWDTTKEVEIASLVVRELKGMTNSNKLTINLIHHFNKWNTQERNWPRWMASIRSSWKIENDTDYVLQVWRDLAEDVPLPDRKKGLNIFTER